MAGSGDIMREELLARYESERQPCEVWTRVMGYFRPISEYNIGKISEFNERIVFNIEKHPAIYQP